MPFMSACVLALATLISQPAFADSSSNPSHSTAILRVGVIQSLTGIAAEDGKTAVQALRLASEHINQSEGLKVELLIEDDGTDSKQAVSAFKKLQGQGVQAIIGPTWSFTFNSVIPLAARDKLVVVNTSTIPECLELSQSQGFAYSTAISVSEHARIFNHYLAQKPAESAIVFYTNNSWGEAQKVAYTKVLQENSFKILNQIPSVNFDINDWRALLPREKKLAADVWLLLLNKSDLDIVIRRARELGVDSRLYASYHFGDTLRLTTQKRLLDQVCFSYPDEQLASEKEFVNSFLGRYGIPPRVFADSSYDALFLLHRALQQSLAQGTSLKEAMDKVTFSGVAGNYQYTAEATFSTGSVSLRCVKEGLAQ